MGFNCGIVGLPNVGKSTLFNALTETSAAEAGNYPFCTINPNVGKVSVNDERLEKLAKLANSKKIIKTQVEFVDIAGLVRGASNGEGLGNQFLSHIKSTDAIIHVLRCFEDLEVTHVDGSVDPIRDLETIETELMLADLVSLEGRIRKLEKKIKNLPEEEKDFFKLMNEAYEILSRGDSLRKNYNKFKFLELISAKPVLYVMNVAESDVVNGNKLTEKVIKHLDGKIPSLIISAKIESEISTLDNAEDKNEFLASLNLKETGLAKIARFCHELLNLITFFTIGEKEARAWSIEKKSKANDAAGVIHTDFKRGFICSETISYDDYVNSGGEVAAKNSGKFRIEGRDYVVNDGDVMHFRFNV